RITAIVAMSIFSHLCTRRIYVQRAQRSQMELLAAQMAIKKRQRSCLPPMKANEGSLHPFHHFPPILTGVAQDRRHSIRSFKLPDAIVEKSNGAYPPTTLDCGTTKHRHPALGQLYEESERGGSRDVGAVNVGAENVPSGAIHNLLLHARTADERGELCGLFDGNRCGAIDPTAVRQDAAVQVGNGLSPAGYGGFEVTKNCGAIGEETDEAGAPRDRGRDESSNPQSDRLEGTCCLTTCVDNGESLVRDCGLGSQKFHNGGGRGLNFGLVRGAEDGEGGSPPRLAVREDTRAGRLPHYKAMQETSRKRKAHEYY
ncbi:hypothetical protein TcCL_Unassigned02076, partial [Trypanosoma cruzi]